MENKLTVGYGRYDPYDHMKSALPRPVVPDNVHVGVLGSSVGKSEALAEATLAALKPTGTDIWGKYKRFMPVAKAFADMSKDPSTKVGCVILGTGSYEVKASGWNGAARGCKADEDERFTDRTTKLQWACHAEANAIANAARVGTPLAGATMVVTHLPCMSCAKLVVQSGIGCVVCPKPGVDFEARWGADFAASRQLFRECGVYLEEFEA